MGVVVCFNSYLRLARDSGCIPPNDWKVRLRTGLDLRIRLKHSAG